MLIHLFTHLAYLGYVSALGQSPPSSLENNSLLKKLNHEMVKQLLSTSNDT